MKVKVSIQYGDCPASDVPTGRWAKFVHNDIVFFVTENYVFELGSNFIHFRDTFMANHGSRSATLLRQGTIIEMEIE